MTNEEILNVLKEVLNEKKDTEFKLQLYTKMYGSSKAINGLIDIAHRDLLDIQAKIVWFSNFRHTPSPCDVDTIHQIKELSDSIKLIIAELL